MMGVAALAFLVSIAYWPGIAGAALTPRWAAMALCAPLILMIRGRIKFTYAHLWGALFLGWCLLTYAWSASPDDTIGMAFKLVLLSCVFCIGSLEEELYYVYIAMAVGLAISGGMAIGQVLGYVALPAGQFNELSGMASGLFVNRNFFAEICTLVAVGLTADFIWWAIILVLPGLVLTNSRGALLALVVPLVIAVWGKSKRYAVGMAAAGCLVIVALSLFKWDSGLHNVNMRYEYWLSTIQNITPFGHGLGAFFESATHPRIEYRFDHPHNEFLEIAFETGWIGLGLFIMFCGTVLSAGRTTETWVFIAVLTEAFVAFPFHEPATAFLGVLAAGCLAGRLRSISAPFGAGGSRVQESPSPANVR